jgi:hypothetical protein
MGKVRSRADKGIILNPENIEGGGGEDLTIEGELAVDSSDDKLKVRLDSVTRSVVTEDQVQILEGKSIDADNNPITNLEVDNLKSGVLNISTTLTGASDTQIPSALAVKTYVDNKNPDDLEDLIVLSGVAVNSTDLGTFTGTTIPDGSDNKEALQALETAVETKATGSGSSVDNELVRYNGTTGKVLQGSAGILSDAGILSGLTGVTSSGTVSSTGTLAIGGNLTEAITTDASTTGSAATITNPSTSIVRLTNASLTSVSMISSPTTGEILTIINATGVDITINNNSGATSANRILTGTKGNIKIRDEASFVVKYDSVETKWMVISGTEIPVVAARYTSNSGQSISTSNTTLTYEDLVVDTHSAMSGTTYTVPVTGIYDINTSYTTDNVSLLSGHSVNIIILKNGSTEARRFLRISANINNAQSIECAALSIPLTAGETITVQGAISVATTMITNGAYNEFSIVMVG